MARTCTDFDNSYRDLTKHFTRLIIDELNACRHPCLKNPQNRSASSEDDRVRFRIIARPPGVTVSGNRSMNLGHNEALLLIHGKIKGEKMTGLDLNAEGSKYRWAFGELVGYEPLIREVNRYFVMFMKERGREMVSSGRYSDFVSKMTGLVDTSIWNFRNAEGYRNLL